MPAPGDGAGRDPPDRASDGGLHLEPRGGHDGGHPTCLLLSASSCSSRRSRYLCVALVLISVSLWSCSLASVPRSEPRGCDSYARTGGTPTTAPGSGAPPGVARPTRGDPTRWDERLFASKHERVFPVKEEFEQVFAPNA